MSKHRALLEILKDEYGITTLSQLDAAIDKLTPIDLYPFVSASQTQRKEEQQDEKRVGSHCQRSGAEDGVLV